MIVALLLASAAMPAAATPAQHLNEIVVRGRSAAARWVDIGFAIRPDGTVDAPEDLRGTMDPGDVRAIEKVVAGRSYASFPGGEGNRYRVERWTFTADYAPLKDSLVRARGVYPHFVSLDITTDDPAPPPGRSAG